MRCAVAARQTHNNKSSIKRLANTQRCGQTHVERHNTFAASLSAAKLITLQWANLTGRNSVLDIKKNYMTMHPNLTKMQTMNLRVPNSTTGTQNKFTTNGQKFATSQCQSPTSRHVKIGCGKFLPVGVGGEFVVQQVVELL